MRLVWGVGLGFVAFASVAHAQSPGTGRIVRAEAVSADREGHCESPQWSRDGRTLAYERVFLQDRKIELNVLEGVFGARKERRIKIPVPDEGVVARAAARFNPDGPAPIGHGEVCRELAWGPKTDPDVFAHACNVAHGSYQIFWNGSDQLTQRPGSFGQPALSPVGWRLAFVSSVQGVEGLMLIDDLMQGAGGRPLARAPGHVDRFPVWSPDGRSLLFTRHGEQGADLYVIRDLTRGAPTRLTRWRGDELNPSWSPDGKRVAFFSRRGERRDRRTGYGIYVADASGRRAPFRVASNAVLTEKKGPTWTPDGRRIVFVRNVQRRTVVDPLYVVAAQPDAKALRLKTGTVSNQDPSITEHKGRWWLAFTSLGYWNAQRLAWRKVFLFPVDHLKRR